jgi:nucleotide-binding universal stress UspA family protein
MCGESAVEFRPFPDAARVPCTYGGGMTRLQTAVEPTVDTASVLATIVCGVDGSPEATEAVRQAALLAPAEGHLALLGVIHAGVVESVASVMPAVTTEPERLLRRRAWEALDEASRDVPGRIEVTTTLRTGPAAALLEVQAEQLGADAIAVGSHGRGRLTAALLGSVTAHVIHDSTRSVLVARSVPVATFPRAIVVGVDESPPSLRALAVSRVLSRRTGATLHAVHVRHGSPLPPALQALDLEHVRISVTPVDALIERASEADLLVVGSGGKRGLRALGSVSEALAHRATGSVLIVR